MQNSLILFIMLFSFKNYSQNNSIKSIEKIETIALGKLEPENVVVVNSFEKYEFLKQNFTDKNNIWPNIDFNKEIFVAGFIETTVYTSRNCIDKITHDIFISNDTCYLNFTNHHIGLSKGLRYYNFFYKITFYNKLDFKYKSSLNFVNYSHMNLNNYDSICNILNYLK